MKKTKRMILVGMGAVTALALGAGQSWALPTSYNQRDQYLTAEPTPKLKSSSVLRTIYLEKGTYTWGLLLDGNTVSSDRKRTIYLKAGEYSWVDTLTPDNGLYDQRSTLADYDGDPAAHLASYAFVEISGGHEWGSELIPPK